MDSIISQIHRIHKDFKELGLDFEKDQSARDLERRLQNVFDGAIAHQREISKEREGQVSRPLDIRSLHGPSILS